MIVLHIFTEEPSARSVFNSILEQILPKEIEYNIYSHQGKQDLEKALKTTLPSISKMPGARILISVGKKTGVFSQQSYLSSIKVC